MAQNKDLQEAIQENLKRLPAGDLDALKPYSAKT